MIRRLPDDLVIRQAAPADIPSIVRLEMENQHDQGGQLSVFFPEHLLNQLMDSMPLMVAIQEDTVVGFLLTSSNGHAQGRGVQLSGGRTSHFYS